MALYDYMRYFTVFYYFTMILQYVSWDSVEKERKGAKRTPAAVGHRGNSRYSRWHSRIVARVIVAIVADQDSALIVAESVK